jgi:hypothetical protein
MELHSNFAISENLLILFVFALKIWSHFQPIAVFVRLKFLAVLAQLNHEQPDFCGGKQEELVEKSRPGLLTFPSFLQI